MHIELKRFASIVDLAAYLRTLVDYMEQDEMLGRLTVVTFSEMLIYNSHLSHEPGFQKILEACIGYSESTLRVLHRLRVTHS